MDVLSTHFATFHGLRTFSLEQATSVQTRSMLLDRGAADEAAQLEKPCDMTGLQLMQLASKRNFEIFGSSIEVGHVSMLTNPTSNFTVPNEEQVDAYEDQDE